MSQNVFQSLQNYAFQKGVINTIILGLDKYLPNNRQGTEAVILNVSSTAALRGIGEYPIYGATKRAIIGLTDAWGQERMYIKSNIRVVAVCPGHTNTTMAEGLWKTTLPGKLYEPPNSKLLYRTQE